MDLKKLIIQHLKAARVLQLATSANNQPWACNLHFYADDGLNLYWISKPDRRHSEDIATNPKTAIVIKLHEDTKAEKYIVGLSAEGTSELLSDEEAKKIGPEYGERLDKDPSLIADILEGRNPHKFYKFTTSCIVLFDTLNFPKDPRQEINL